MKSISLCMIVCDEEDMLANALDSVSGLVNEIIIVDTGSTDKTKDIAKKFNARVIDYEWKDDFSDARNYSLKHATGDWILVLDADETISQRDHKKMLHLIEDSKFEAYSLVQRTYGNNLKHAEYVNRGSDKYSESLPYLGWIPSSLVRLFRNNPKYRFRYKIHEVIEPAIEEAGGVIKSATVPIHHFTYEKPPDFVDAKHKRYLEYGLQQIDSTPSNPKPYLEVALVYIENKDFNKAEELLLKGISIAPQNADLYDALATVYLDSNRAPAAEQVVRKGLALRPDDFVMLNKLASVCMARQAFDEAENLLKRAKKLSPDSVMVYNNLGLLFAITNRPAKAINAFQNTVRINPNNLYALTSIGMLYVNLKQFKNALPVLEQAYNIASDDVRVLYHLAVTRAALKQRLPAIELLKRAQQLQPGDPEINKRLKELV